MSTTIASLLKRFWIFEIIFALLLLTVGLYLYWPNGSSDPASASTPTQSHLQANEAVYPPRSLPNVVPTGTLAILWGDILHDEVYSMTQSAWRYAPDPNGYISFTSRCETSIRPAAELAYAMAVAVNTGLLDYNPAFKSEVAAKASLLIKSLAYHHIANNSNTQDQGRWGYDPAADDSICLNSTGTPGGGKANMQSAWWAEMAGFAGWLGWNNPIALSPEDKERVRNMVQYEANRYTRSLMYVGSYDPLTRLWSNIWSPNILYLRDKQGVLPAYNSTFAEEDAWNVRILDLAMAMMPDHNNWEIWNSKATELALASLSRPSDNTDSSTSVAGRPLTSWLNGSNIEEDGTLYDHEVIYPNYMGAIIHSMHSAILSAFAGKSTPLSRLHNVNLVYDALVNRQFDSPPYLPPGGTIYRPNPQETSTAQPDYEIYYPQILPHDEDPLRKHDLFAQIDTEVAALGLDKVGDQSNNAAYWANLHIKGVYAPQDTEGEGYPSSPLKGQILGDYDLPKAADAYLMLWLQSQSSTSAASHPISDLPTPWRDSDLAASENNTTSIGSSRYDGGKFTLITGQNNNTAHMVYRAWSGDGELIAHLDTPSNSTGSTESGLFMREEITKESAFLQFGPDNTKGGTSLVYKAPQGASEVSAHSTDSGSWLRLVREGSNFSSYVSADGANPSDWALVGSVDLPISSRIYLGMFVTGQNAQTIFDSVQLNRSDPELAINRISASPSSTLSPLSTAQGASSTPQWSAQGDGGASEAPWLEYDLRSTQEISSLGITWAEGATKSYTFEVLASDSTPAPEDSSPDNPAQRWDRVFAGTSESGKNGEEKFYFVPVAARYIRILGRGNSTDDWNRITDLTVYGTPLTEAPVRAATSPAHLGENKPENVLDKTLSTNWSAQITPESGASLQIDLGNTVPIDTLAVAWTNGNHARYRFRLEASNDQNKWTTLYSGASSGTTQVAELYDFPKTSAQFIKLICTDSSDGSKCAVSEIKAFTRH